MLDYEPAYAERSEDRDLLRRGGDARKSTGSFYTPQTLTDYVVRRTLHPLVDGATADRILQLRIVDPAMGSAAFLVSACRYLARAYERALVRDGRGRRGDIDEADRALFRRLIAQRCLFGVDMNPTAVQLARLSLWLATLSANKPLTFLDHHLVCGNSLIGASPIDIARQPPGVAIAAPPNRAERPCSQTQTSSRRSRAPSSSVAGWPTRMMTPPMSSAKRNAGSMRLRAAREWKSIADLWCACWMWPEPRTAPGPGGVRVARRQIDDGTLRAAGKHVGGAASATQDRITGAHHFFHWMLEFPEAYFDEAGRPLADGGFDAVIGNPPWDMLRAGGDRESVLSKLRRLPPSGGGPT